MKKTVLVSFTAIAFMAISATVVFTSCKKNVLPNNNAQTEDIDSRSIISNPTGIGTISNPIPNDHVGTFFGKAVPVGSSGGQNMYGCDEAEGVCHFGPAMGGNTVRFSDYDGTTIRMNNVDANFAGNDPLIIHADTYLSEEVKAFFGIQNGLIQAGVYPMHMDPTSPQGFFDFQIIP